MLSFYFYNFIIFQNLFYFFNNFLLSAALHYFHVIYNITIIYIIIALKYHFILVRYLIFLI